MLSKDEFIAKIEKVYPHYFEITKKGNKVLQRKRGISAIFYPEHFKDISIEECCKKLSVPCCLSPLHDKDIKDENTGEIKKPHYHLLMYFEGKKSLWDAYCLLIGAFPENSFSTLEYVGDMGVLVRYQIHLDDPEKAQYSVSDIKDFCGFNHLDYIDKGSDLMGNLLKLKNIVRDNSFIFYSELDDYLEENDTILWTSLHKTRSLQRDILDYMKSREYLLQYQGNVEKGYTKIKIDDKTEKVIFNRQIINQDAI